MKRFAGMLALTAVALIALIGALGHFVPSAKAQATLVSWSFIAVADPASCKSTGVTTLCATSNAPQAVLISVNSSPTFTQLFPAQAGANPVASFNGRTGAVVPAQGDYSYSQLGTKPTSIACPSATLGPTGLVSGSAPCVIQ